jgi:hypothetical protein
MFHACDAICVNCVTLPALRMVQLTEKHLQCLSNIINKCWLVDDNLCLRDFGPYVIVVSMCVITITILMLLMDFRLYVIFMNVCLCFYNRCHGNAVKMLDRMFLSICSFVIICY